MKQGKCEICGSDQKLCVDHDHQTGIIRGTLCFSCNVALGFLKDDPAITGKATLYLLEKQRYVQSVVNGVAGSEVNRCLDMIGLLTEKLSLLPKGTIHVRLKNYKNQQYRYHYLKFRNGERSVSKHINEREVESVTAKLLERSKICHEIACYRKTIDNIFYKKGKQHETEER